MKSTKNIFVLYCKIDLTLQIPQNGLKDPEGAADFTLRTATLEIQRLQEQVDKQT